MKGKTCFHKELTSSLTRKLLIECHLKCTRLIRKLKHRTSISLQAQHTSQINCIQCLTSTTTATQACCLFQEKRQILPRLWPSSQLISTATTLNCPTLSLTTSTKTPTSTRTTHKGTATLRTTQSIHSRLISLRQRITMKLPAQSLPVICSTKELLATQWRTWQTHSRPKPQTTKITRRQYSHRHLLKWCLRIINTTDWLRILGSTIHKVLKRHQDTMCLFAVSSHLKRKTMTNSCLGSKKVKQTMTLHLAPWVVTTWKACWWLTRMGNKLT